MHSSCTIRSHSASSLSAAGQLQSLFTAASDTFLSVFTLSFSSPVDLCDSSCFRFAILPAPARTPPWQTRFRQWRCSGSLSWISGAAMSKKWSQLSISLGPLMSTTMQKHMFFVRIPDKCCADTDEVVNKYCFVHWVWVRGTTRQSLTRLLVHCLGVWWRFAMESQCIRPTCSHLPHCRRIDGETEVWVTFFSAVATRSIQSSTNVSSLRRGCTLCSQRYVVSVVRAPSIPAARRANIDLLCMPTPPSCMQDTALFCCVCRFIFSESCLLVTLRNQAVSLRKESEKNQDKHISSTSYFSSSSPRR